MSQEVTHAQSTVTSPGTCNSDCQPCHFSQASQLSSPQVKHSTINHKFTTLSTPTATSPAHGCYIPPCESIDPAACPSSPARPTQSSPCNPFSDTSNTRDSVQDWLKGNREPTSSLIATKTSQEQGTQVIGRKRKRGAPLELEQAGPTTQLTRNALKKHLATTMSSDQPSLTNV